tara:strand:- start:8114 stop:8932 length:819 start_codon:yes stop_codon:yes gene_type:complete
MRPARKEKVLKCFYITLLSFLLIVASENGLAQPAAIEDTTKVISDIGRIESPESSSSAYGFQELWNQSDLVARITLLILLGMSIGTWTIFISKYIEQINLSAQCKKINSQLAEKLDFNALQEKIPESSSVGLLIKASLDAKNDLETIKGVKNDEDWVVNCIQEGILEFELKLHKGLTFLATVGSTAPFVGLFGTVWAIYHALIKIGLVGEASLDKVAGPVGEALVMTAIGLAVAVPAVLGYNWLVRRNKVLLRNISSLSNKLMFKIIMRQTI